MTLDPSDYRNIQDDIHTVTQPEGPPWPHPTAWTPEKERILHGATTAIHEHVHHTATHDEGCALIAQHMKLDPINAHPKHDVLHLRVLDAAAFSMIGHVKRVIGDLPEEAASALRETGRLPEEFAAKIDLPADLVEAHAKIKAIQDSHVDLKMALLHLHRYVEAAKNTAHGDALDAIAVVRNHCHKIMALPIPPIFHPLHVQMQNMIINKLHWHVGPHHTAEEGLEIVRAKMCGAKIETYPLPDVSSTPAPAG